MSSVFLKVSNIPLDIDEGDLARNLLRSMENSLKDAFVTCEIRRKEGVAVLEFELSPCGNFTSLETITMNGIALSILNKDCISNDSTPAYTNGTNGMATGMHIIPAEYGKIVPDKSSPMPDCLDNIPKEETPLESADEQFSVLGTADIMGNDNPATTELIPTVTSAAMIDSTPFTPLQTYSQIATSMPCTAISSTSSLLISPVTTLPPMPTPSTAVVQISSVTSSMLTSEAVSSDTMLACSVTAPITTTITAVTTPLTTPLAVTRSTSVSTPPIPTPRTVSHTAVLTPSIMTPPMPMVTHTSMLMPLASPMTGTPTVSTQVTKKRVLAVNNVINSSSAAIPKRGKQSAVGVVAPKTVFFDLETTGLDLNSCEIVQIAAAFGQQTYNVFVMPLNGIPFEASRVNGLTVIENQLYKNGKVVHVTDPAVAWQGFISFLKSLGSVVLMAHNGERFDFPLLARDIQRLNLTQELRSVVAGCVDSITMFKAKLPKRAAKRKPWGLFKLFQLAQDYGLSTDEAHDALGDVRTLSSLCRKIGIVPDDTRKHKKCLSFYL